MHNGVSFKKASKNEIGKFLGFFRSTLGKLFPHYSKNSINYTIEADYSPNWLKGRLLEGKKTVFVAMKDDKIIGYLLSSRSIVGVSFCDWLAVETNYQNKGIATKLIGLWEKDAISEGAHALHLWTMKKNLDFYGNRGFVNGGLFPKAWHGHDSYLLYKPLREPSEANYLKRYLKSKKNI